MKRVLLIAALLVLLIATPASAVTFQNGSAEQHAMMQSILRSGDLDFSIVEERIGEITVLLYNGGGGYARRAQVSIGELGDWGYTVPHEFMHQLWYAMSPFWRLKWEWFCTYGMEYDARLWLQNPAECFAECMRVAYFNCSAIPVQTQLRIVAPDRCRAFVERWMWSIGSPKTAR